MDQTLTLLLQLLLLLLLCPVSCYQHGGNGVCSTLDMFLLEYELVTISQSEAAAMWAGQHRLKLIGWWEAQFTFLLYFLGINKSQSKFPIIQLYYSNKAK